jgi:hypothetical protein
LFGDFSGVVQASVEQDPYEEDVGETFSQSAAADEYLFENFPGVVRTPVEQKLHEEETSVTEQIFKQVISLGIAAASHHALQQSTRVRSNQIASMFLWSYHAALQPELENALRAVSPYLVMRFVEPAVQNVALEVVDDQVPSKLRKEAREAIQVAIANVAQKILEDRCPPENPQAKSKNVVEEGISERKRGKMKWEPPSERPPPERPPTRRGRRPFAESRQDHQLRPLEAVPEEDEPGTQHRAQGPSPPSAQESTRMDAKQAGKQRSPETPRRVRFKLSGGGTEHVHESDKECCEWCGWAKASPYGCCMCLPKGCEPSSPPISPDVDVGSAGSPMTGIITYGESSQQATAGESSRADSPTIPWSVHSEEVQGAMSSAFPSSAFPEIFASGNVQWAAVPSNSPNLVPMEDVQETVAPSSPEVTHVKNIQEAAASTSPEVVHIKNVQETVAPSSPEVTHVKNIQEAAASTSPEVVHVKNIQEAIQEAVAPTSPEVVHVKNVHEASAPAPQAAEPEPTKPSSPSSESEFEHSQEEKEEISERILAQALRPEQDPSDLPGQDEPLDTIHETPGAEAMAEEGLSPPEEDKPQETTESHGEVREVAA